MSEEKRIVEINGVKLEVDMRHAKRLDCFRVGDTVKVLKKTYGDKYEVYPGVIVSFVEFKNLPTIEVLYLDQYHVKFQAINSETDDAEIAPASQLEVCLGRSAVEDRLVRELNVAQKALEEAQARIDIFREYFGKHFEAGEK